jgi:H+-transporting ATPase
MVTKVSLSIFVPGRWADLTADQSKARSILERKRLSEKGKGVGTKGAQGAPGQASRKEAESSDRTKQRQGEGGEKDADGDEEEEHDDEEEIDKGPAICSVDQSAMTGESLAVDKFHGDVVYYTTISKRGKCYARSELHLPFVCACLTVWQ